MSAFTMYLHEVIDHTGGETELLPMTFKNIQMGHITKLTGGKVGLDFFPIFDEEYRDILKGKIVDRYWNREIGFETIDLFMMKMRVKLNEIMPFYNQLYDSTMIEYAALSTIHLQTVTSGQTTGEENTSGNTTATAQNESGSRAVSSQTPQTMLSGDEDYASAATDTNSKTVSESENDSTAMSTSQAESSGDSLVTGYQGTPADLIMRYRDSFLNIDLMVLRDLEELFMQVFDNGDSYTQRGFHGYY